MRVIIFLDQIQSGTGSKDITNIELGVEKSSIGAAINLEEYVNNSESKIIATTYCGTSYYLNNKEIVKNKMANLLNKTKTDILICGPCYNFENFIKMAISLSTYIKKHCNTIPIIMCSDENLELINEYKDKIIMLKMPKKGGVGLRESFKNLEKALLLIKNNNLEEIKNISY